MNINRFNNNDNERFQHVALTSMVLCFLLIIFPVLKMSSFGGRLIVEHETAVVVFLTVLVLFFQLDLLSAVTHHRVNSSFCSIFIILVLTCAITVAEVFLVSLDATVFVLIFWVVIIAEAVDINKQEIYNIDMVSNILDMVSNTHAWISIIFRLNLVYFMYYCLVHTLL